VRIFIYYKDHDPPHFHHEHAGVIAVIRIADGALIRGTISSRDNATLLPWVDAHRAELALDWVLLKADLPLKKIAYP